MAMGCKVHYVSGEKERTREVGGEREKKGRECDRAQPKKSDRSGNVHELRLSCHGAWRKSGEGEGRQARMRGAIYLIRCIKLIKIRAASYQLPRRVSQARPRLGGAGLPSCSSARINKCAKVQATLPPYPVPPTPQSPSLLPACSPSLSTNPT